MKLFVLVLARSAEHVKKKIEELNVLKLPHLIVCGKNLDLPNVVYRKPRGKYDAINFGFKFIPKDTDVVVLNDVDTKINNFEASLRLFRSGDADLVFVKIYIKEGPQQLFYGLLDSIRRRLLITASGELMLVRYNLLKKIFPIKPCKAEDSYLLFKALEFKFQCMFCEDCYVETERTKTAEKEEIYKRKTVGGIYQALAYTNPPLITKLFYTLLPLFSPLLLFSGRRGYFWMKGILYGLVDYLMGDRSGSWETTYKE
jgi:hypothetical protein